MSCQWNNLDTLQETYIVLYKLLPLIIGERVGLALRRAFTERRMTPNSEKTHSNKCCGRNAGGYQSPCSTQPSGRFLAAGALTSKEGLVPSSTALDCTAGNRRVHLRATSVNLIKETNTICSPERHLQR